MDQRKFVQTVVGGLNDMQLEQLQIALTAILDGSAPAPPTAETTEPLPAPAHPDLATMPLEEYGFRLTKSHRDKKYASQGYFTQCARSFSRFLGATATVADASTSNLVAYSKWLHGEVARKQISATTMQSRFSGMRSLWWNAASEGIIAFGSGDPKQLLSDLACLDVFHAQEKLTRRVIEDLEAHIKRPAIAGDLTHANAIHLVREWRNQGKVGDSMTSRKKCFRRLAVLSGIEPPDMEPRPATKPQPDTHMGQQTIYSFLHNVYAPRRLVGPSSDNTIRLYNVTIRKFSRFLGRPAVLPDLTDENVAGYLRSEFAANKSPHSVEKECRQLQCLWRFASRKKLVDTFPEIRAPVAPEVVPDAFTPDELERLFAAARSQTGDMCGVPAGLWWEGLIAVVYDSSERIGAILKARWDQLNGEWLTVPAIHRKGAKAGKRFKLRPETVTALSAMRSHSTSDKIFASPYCYGYHWTLYGKILKAAGLPNVRRGKFHKIRRTVATYYEAAGGNATQLLGHSSRKVTERYIDTRIAQTPQPADIVAPIVRRA